MNDPKFTPGPWTARDNDILGPDGIEIAFAAMSDNGDEPVWYPAEANARLMAAAPDLFAAVIRARNAVRSFHDIGIPKDQRQKLWELYQASPEMTAINAALTKATAP